MNPLQWRLTAAILAIAMVAGCATHAPAPTAPAAPPAAVELGPLIRLLEVPPLTDKVRAVAAPDGSVHVLVASSGPRAVTEVVVSPSGAVQHRTVVRDVSPSSVDAAFDRQGRLHALVGVAHFVCEEGVWRRSSRTPWEGFEVTPSAVRFVANAPDLVWVFPVHGTDVGAAGRWEVYGMGGAFGAGIIWPWFTRGARAVVVADSPAGFGPWIVIDPEGPMDTAVVDATADGEGNVYLAYTASHEGMLASSTPWYVKLAPDVLAGTDGAEWKRPGARASLQQLRATKGKPLPAEVLIRGESAYRANTIPNPPHFFGGQGGFRVSTNLSQRPRAAVVAEAHDKWWGRGFPIQYVEFDDLRWSSPIEVGLADHGGGAVFGGFIWDAYDIATTDSGRTLVVWPTAQGIVGRWIDHKQ